MQNDEIQLQHPKSRLSSHPDCQTDLLPVQARSQYTAAAVAAAYAATAAAAVVGRPKFGGTSFRALTFWKRCSPLASGCEPIFSNPALAPGHCSRRRAAAVPPRRSYDAQRR